jgi:hypothetical protein
MPDRDFRLGKLDVEWFSPAFRFCSPGSYGSPAMEASLTDALRAYLAISVLDSFMRNAVSKSKSGPRYLCGICNRKARSSELLGQWLSR